MDTEQKRAIEEGLHGIKEELRRLNNTLYMILDAWNDHQRMEQYRRERWEAEHWHQRLDPR